MKNEDNSRYLQIGDIVKCEECDVELHGVTEVFTHEMKHWFGAV